MRTPQLFWVTLVLAATAACNRTEADANAKRTADQLKVAAAQAGDRLADSWLTTKIQAQYFADDDIKARHINVSTRDRVVTLTGYVDNPAQREEALQIAQNTDGVCGVRDQIAEAGQPREGAVATTGTLPSPGEGKQSADDAQVTARVQSKFFANDRVKGTQIVVDTHNGVVTLSGAVAGEDERAQALRIARTTEGVKRVEDDLTVTPEAPSGLPREDDETLTTTIQARYFVDPQVKASAIDVSTKDRVVLLQGTVPDQAARDQALAIAQNTEGVVQVVDRLQVGGRGRGVRKVR